VRLRVLVYNVRQFRDEADVVARVVERFAPDVVLMNESGGRLRLRRFAKAVGMEKARDPWSPFRRRVKNAVLVRPPWRILDHRLHRFAGSARFYPRGALVAHLDRSGLRISAASVHLGLRPAERRNHAEQLVRILRALNGPLVVGGDLNELPGGRAVTHLTERLLWDAWLLGGDVAGETYPADEPTARIDYLFVSEGIRVERAIVPPLPDVHLASDHRPVVAELVVPDVEERS
jgi:endonuclease/exonuclease/phosphatase family metal-dependent hydrolase